MVYHQHVFHHSRGPEHVSHQEQRDRETEIDELVAIFYDCYCYSHNTSMPLTWDPDRERMPLRYHVCGALCPGVQTGFHDERPQCAFLEKQPKEKSLAVQPKGGSMAREIKCD